MGRSKESDPLRFDKAPSQLNTNFNTSDYKGYVRDKKQIHAAKNAAESGEHYHPDSPFNVTGRGKRNVNQQAADIKAATILYKPARNGVGKKYQLSDFERMVILRERLGNPDKVDDEKLAKKVEELEAKRAIALDHRIVAENAMVEIVQKKYEEMTLDEQLFASAVMLTQVAAYEAAVLASTPRDDPLDKFAQGLWRIRASQLKDIIGIQKGLVEQRKWIMEVQREHDEYDVTDETYEALQRANQALGLASLPEVEELDEEKLIGKDNRTKKTKGKQG